MTLPYRFLFVGGGALDAPLVHLQMITGRRGRRPLRGKRIATGVNALAMTGGVFLRANTVRPYNVTIPGGERSERRRWRIKRGERVAAVEKIEDQRKPDDFFGHRNRKWAKTMTDALGAHCLPALPDIESTLHNNGKIPSGTQEEKRFPLSRARIACRGIPAGCEQSVKNALWQLNFRIIGI